MADFNALSVDTNYADFPGNILAITDALAQQLSVGSHTNIPAGTIQFNLATGKWQKRVGSSWNDLINETTGSKLDFSNTAQTAVVNASNISLPDSVGTTTGRITLGDSDELSIRYYDYDGTLQSQIESTQPLILESDNITLRSVNNEQYFTSVFNGSTKLYYNGSESLATTATGVSCQGDLITNVQSGEEDKVAMVRCHSLLQVYGHGGKTAKIEVGPTRDGSGASYIDFIGDTTYTDYGTRIARNNGGVNTETDIVHRGTGLIRLKAQDAGKIEMRTSNQVGFYMDANQRTVIGSGSSSTPLGDLHAFGTSGTWPTFNVGHSAGDVEGEAIRFSRTDLPTIRYHSIKAKHSGGAGDNYLSFHIHDGGDAPSYATQSSLLKLVGTGNVQIPGGDLEVVGGNKIYLNRPTGDSYGSSGATAGFFTPSTTDGNLVIFSDAEVRLFESDTGSERITFDINPATPSIYFNNVAETKIHSVDLRTIGFSTKQSSDDSSQERFRVSELGVKATGTVDITGELNFVGAGNKFVDFDTLDASQEVKLRHMNTAADAYDTFISAKANGYTKLFYDNGTKFQTRSDGVQVDGNIIVTNSANTKLELIDNTGTDSRGTIVYNAGDDDSAADALILGVDHQASGIAPNSEIRFSVDNSAKIRINHNGAIGIGTGSAYGSSGQVLTSQGSGSAVAWSDIDAGVLIKNFIVKGSVTAGKAVSLDVTDSVAADKLKIGSYPTPTVIGSEVDSPNTDARKRHFMDISRSRFIECSIEPDASVQDVTFKFTGYALDNGVFVKGTTTDTRDVGSSIGGNIREYMCSVHILPLKHTGMFLVYITYGASDAGTDDDYAVLKVADDGDVTSYWEAGGNWSMDKPQKSVELVQLSDTKFYNKLWWDNDTISRIITWDGEETLSADSLARTSDLSGNNLTYADKWLGAQYKFGHEYSPGSELTYIRKFYNDLWTEHGLKSFKHVFIENASGTQLGYVVKFIARKSYIATLHNSTTQLVGNIDAGTEAPGLTLAEAPTNEVEWIIVDNTHVIAAYFNASNVKVYRSYSISNTGVLSAVSNGVYTTTRSDEILTTNSYMPNLNASSSSDQVAVTLVGSAVQTTKINSDGTIAGFGLFVKGLVKDSIETTNSTVRVALEEQSLYKGQIRYDLQVDPSEFFGNQDNKLFYLIAKSGTNIYVTYISGKAATEGARWKTKSLTPSTDGLSIPFEYVGVATQTQSTDGQTASVAVKGVADGLSSLTVGSKYYVSSAYDGTLTTDSTTGIEVGKAISTTELLLK